MSDGSYIFNKREYGYDETTGTHYPKEWMASDKSKGTFDITVKSGTSLPFMKEKRGSLARQLFKDQVIDQEELLTSLEWPRKEEIMRRMQEKAAAMPAPAAPPAPVA